MSDVNLPHSWLWTTLGEICSRPQYGYTTKAADSGDTLFLRTTDITSGKIDWDTVPFCAENPEDPDKYQLHDGDVVISRAGSVGFSHLIQSPPKAVFASYLIRFRPFIDRGYFAFFLKSPFYWHSISDRKSGIAVGNVNAQKLAAISIPLPPLAEQKRIVAKIEELFSELEAGEESLRAARRQLGVYRQSLLKQAFEGKLTEKWRTENPDKLEEWTSTTVGKIGRIETGTTPPTENQANYGGDLPFFKPTDLEQGRYVKDARSYLSASGRQSARVLPAGSILVTCIGATIGKTGLAQLACATNQQINSISPAEGIAPEFAYFQVISPQFQEQIKTNASSTTLPILNKSKFSAFPFVLCSLPEQQEIVRLLDEQFEAIERNEREIDAALKRSEALRQAILKKAFTGQLVAQDPADEPASALLARLHAERGATTQPGRSRRKV